MQSAVTLRRASPPNSSSALQLTIEIPWETWYLAEADKACVQKTPPNLPAILLGDVLFRRCVTLRCATSQHNRVPRATTGEGEDK